MIALPPSRYRSNVSRLPAETFETMLPVIQKVAAFAFRRLPQWRREELTLDVIAKAYEAFARLVAQDRADLAYPTVLAVFAVKQTWGGRQVGVRQNVNDAMSPYAQLRRGFAVQSLDRPDSSGRWEDLAVEDKRATPAEVAAFRIDFRDWLGRLDRRQRALALRLATGESAKDAALHFRVSQARISQCRRELKTSWEAFQEQLPAA